MKPIAQTFIINEPASGVEAVFLTKLDLYFQSKSSTYGVEVQIRETDNGFPTRKVVPYGTKIIESSEVNISQDASQATTFEFKTPVLLRSNEQYAIVVVPIAGNPDYNIWIGSLGGNDVTTNTPIFKNNELGSLFISSNDLNFTPIQNESLKYTAYIANFTSSSATAVFKNDYAEHFVVTNKIGDFLGQEKVVVSNNYLNISSLTITGSNTFTTGEIVFQPAGSGIANLTQATAYGTVYFANTTKVLMSNTIGAFNTTDTLRGVTSNNIASAPSFANQTVVTAAACTVITVPDANSSITTDFTVNNFIYIGKNTGANIQIQQIKAVDAGARTLTLDGPVKFTDTNAIIGRVKDDANLTGNFTSITGGENMFLTLTGAENVNSTSNFANCQGALLIGRTSGASVVISDVYDLMYEGLTTTIPDIEPNQTKIFWSVIGTANNSGRTTDNNATNVANEIPYEFIDKTRVVMSRSNEFANPPSAGIGNSSLVVTASMQTGNNKISPYIDTIRNSVTTTHNLVYPESTLSGYIISYSNSAGNFSIGDVVEQANSTTTANGTVFFSNSSILYITDVQGSNSSSIATFNISNTTIYNTSKAITANITAVTSFNETTNATSSATRYISKNVILAEQQDAEDLVCFVTAYRPSGTNLKVYGKFLSGGDNDPFQSKDWSALVETTSTSLQSSLVNTEDYVELVYELPTSVQIISNSASATLNSANLSVNSTDPFNAGSFIYISDNSSGAINVRQINQIANSTSMILDANLSFTSSNCAVGVIPGLQSQHGAFKYANNNGVTRYISSTDGVFDTFKVFSVKIVLTSNSHHIVPKMADMRCLALQV